MGISTPTIDILRQLSDSIVSTLGQNREVGTSHKVASAPANPDVQLLIDGETYRYYRGAAERLATESEVEHLTGREIDDELWKLSCDLGLDGKYKDQEARLRRIEEFAEAISKPWEDFETMFELRHARPSDAFFEVRGVRFQTLTDELVDEWRLRDHPVLESVVMRLLGKPVALVRTRGGSARTATLRAKQLVDQALNVVRVALSGAIRFRVADVQMLFSRGQLFVVRHSAAEGLWETNRELGFTPIEFEFSGATVDVLKDYLSEQGLLETALAPRLQARVDRAVYWIGSSIARESFDDKVIALCTALESLLSAVSDGRKAEALSLRYMLLQSALDRPFTDPIGLYYLYELRSDIVHGSENGICGDGHYMHLRYLAIETLSSFIALCKSDASLKSLSGVFKRIQTKEALKLASSWLSEHPDKRAVKVAELANNI